MMSSGRTAFHINYEVSPIVLVGGIAANMPAGKLAILNMTQAGSFPSGVTGPVDEVEANAYFAQFKPMTGGSLIDQALGDYPLANQQVAANAVIEQPLTVSMLMIAPAKDAGDLQRKQAIISALKASLDKHNLSGGLYNVNTPGYLYQNCILTKMRDVTPDEGNQPQATWQLDFIQPLVTLESAQAAQNSLMQKVTAGAPVSPGPDGVISPSGSAIAVGDPLNPSTAQVVPSASGLGGTGLSQKSSIFSTGVVSRARSVLGSASAAATSTALASFNLSRATQAFANTALRSVGQSVAGGVVTAAGGAVRAAQAATLTGGNPVLGRIAAQFSVRASEAVVNASTQALQRGITSSVGASGVATLRDVQASAVNSLQAARAALADRIIP